MAAPIQGKPGATPKPGAVTAATANPKQATGSSGTFSSDQLLHDANGFPPLYEAAILYAADYYEAAQETLKSQLKSKEGKDSIRVWLMLFDLYHLTNNRQQFDALSMLFSVKFERSPPVWAESADNSDPRRKEKRDRKDYFAMKPGQDGAILAEIDRFEAYARDRGSCRVGFEKVAEMLPEEAELFSIVLQRLRRFKVTLWFNGFNEFTAMLKKSINDMAGQTLTASQGYWSLLFELYILDGKLHEYEELGLEYAVAFEMSPPPWETVNRPSSESVVTSTGTHIPLSADPIGFPLKGVISPTSKDMLQQLSIYAGSKPQEVLVDMGGLLRIDFAMAGQFFEAIRAIHLSQKRVILANLNELVAALLEVFGMTKHAILMRKKAA